LVVEFRVFGPLSVVDGGEELVLGAAKQRTLLALLLLHRNELVASERLIDWLWEGQQPATAQKSLQVYVSGLRKVLGAERLETQGRSYLFHVEPGELDLDRFLALVEEAREAEPRRAAELLRRALDLYGGDPLPELRYDEAARAEIARLEELRLHVVEQRVDADLALGRHAQLAPELEALVTAYPLRERLRWQQMLALYRSGRQADALAAYQQARRALAEELGVDPGPELRELERAILNQDPGLGKPAQPPPLDPRRRRGLLLLVGGALLVAAAAIAVVASRGGNGLKTIGSGMVGAIDPRTGRIVAAIGAGNQPSRLAVANGRLWVLNAGDRTITAIDTDSYRHAATFGPNVVPTDLAATTDAVWVGAAGGNSRVPSSVWRFDAVRHAPAGVTPLPASSGPAGTTRPPEERYLVAGGGRVYAIGPTLHPVEISPQTGKVVRAFAASATSIAYGDGALWGINGKTVVRITPKTGATASVDLPSLFDLGGIAAGGGFAWVTSPYEGVVWRIDPRPPGQVTSVRLSYGVSTIAYGDGAVWVGNRYDDSVSRIDPRSEAVTRVATIPAPQDIAIDRQHVFIASGSAEGRNGPLTSTACGPVKSGGRRPDLLIASDLALQGSESATTAASVATIEQVLAERGYRAGRFQVGYQSCDDSTASASGFDDAQCVANAASYATDSTIVGVIGTSDSQCALDEIPIANRAPKGPLAMVSPFDTGPFLTRRGLGQAAQTLAQFYAAGPRNFVRTIGADHIQVAAAAKLAQTLGLHRVAVIFNQQGMLQVKEKQWFGYAAARLRGVRTVPILWNGHKSTLGRMLRYAKVDGTFLVGYAVGSPQQAAATAATLGRVLPGRPAIVTDAFGPWSSTKGSAARFYATLAGITAPSQLTPRGRRLLAKLPANTRIPYAVAQTQAATDLLLNAIAASDGTRRSIVDHLRSSPALDRWGDPRTAPVTVFRLGGNPPNQTRLPFLAGGRIFTTITPPPSAVPPG
jgi:DNA-binding SARP family transcriptional activator